MESYSRPKVRPTLDSAIKKIISGNQSGSAPDQVGGSTLQTGAQGSKDNQVATSTTPFLMTVGSHRMGQPTKQPGSGKPPAIDQERRPSVRAEHKATEVRSMLETVRTGNRDDNSVSHSLESSDDSSESQRPMSPLGRSEGEKPANPPENSGSFRELPTSPSLTRQPDPEAFTTGPDATLAGGPSNQEPPKSQEVISRSETPKDSTSTNHRSLDLKRSLTSKNSLPAKLPSFKFAKLINASASRKKKKDTEEGRVLDAGSGPTALATSQRIPKRPMDAQSIARNVERAQKESLRQAISKGERLFAERKLQGPALARFVEEAEAMGAKAKLRHRAVNVDALVDLYEQHALDEFIATHANIPAYALGPGLLKAVRADVLAAFVNVRALRRLNADVQLKVKRSNDAATMDPNAVARGAAALEKAQDATRQIATKAFESLEQVIAFSVQANIARSLRIHDQFTAPDLATIGLHRPEALFPDEVMARLNKQSTQAEAIGDVAAALAEKIADLDEKDQFSWITSDGEGLQSQLMDLLDAANFAFPSDVAENVAAQIHAIAMSSIPGMRLGPNRNDLTLGNRTYRLQRTIGTPSAGTVYLYASGDRRLVVKSTAGENPLALPAAMLEARHQMKAFGRGHENVVGMKGAIRTADGHLLTLMEFASRGDVNAVMNGLKDQAKIDKIKAAIPGFDPKRIKHHLLHGIFSAVAHMHRNEIVHIDLNGRNLFMDSAFTVKLGDFGTAQFGDPTAPLLNSPVDSPYYVAPEAGRLRSTLTRKTKEIKQALIDGGDKRSPSDVSRLATAQANEEMLKDPASQLTSKADMWSLGIMLFEAVKGKYPFPDFNFVSDLEAHILNFCKKDASERLTALGLDPADPVDRLIFALLDPDPARRPKAADVLALGLFESLDTPTATQWHDALHAEIDPAPMNLVEGAPVADTATALELQDGSGRRPSPSEFDSQYLKNTLKDAFPFM